MILKNLGKGLLGKAAFAAALPLLLLAAVTPAFGQSAEIRSAGVYYIDQSEVAPDPTAQINQVYCNWDADTISKAGTTAYKGGIVNLTTADHSSDPFKTSALIEYDQPFPAPDAINKYPNQCLAMCFDVYCTNKPNGATTYSIAFPLQQIRFEVAKYYGSRDIMNPETNPAVRVIDKSILDNTIIDYSTFAVLQQALQDAKNTLVEAQADLSNKQAELTTATTTLTTERDECSALTYDAQTIVTNTYNSCSNNLVACYKDSAVDCTSNTHCDTSEACVGAFTELGTAKTSYFLAQAAVATAQSNLDTKEAELATATTALTGKKDTCAAVHYTYVDPSTSISTTYDSCISNLNACYNDSSVACTAQEHCDSDSGCTAALNELNTAKATYLDAQAAKEAAQTDLTNKQNDFTTANTTLETKKDSCSAITYTAQDTIIDTYSSCCSNVGTCYNDNSISCAANTGCSTSETCTAAFNELSTAKAGYFAAETAVTNAETAVTNAETGVANAQQALDDASKVTGQDLSNYMCAAYSCAGSASDFEKTQTCPNPQFECAWKLFLIQEGETELCSTSRCCRPLNNPSEGYIYNYSTAYSPDSVVSGTTVYCGDSGNGVNGRETPCILRAYGTGKGYNEPIRFCTSWDGSYEILGEFGKTNGEFGFRANVQTKYPGDGIAVENIEVDDNFIYPSSNQYPIKVDVTNVHTVRTTPTVMGELTAVQATPYTIAYRISKDSDVKIQLYDASAAVPNSYQSGDVMDNGEAELVLTHDSVVRKLIDWKPRIGEGFLGSDKDIPVVESEMWDGRDDNGRLLPANNYLISVQAKSQDEWPGTDFSRAVTRQMSLDPLKLTDIQVVGLSKQSTAYAMIRYVPTEASNVYFEVYSPGTIFESQYTRGYEPTGSRPVVSNNTGVLVYSNAQQRGRGMKYADRWDGLCHNANGCAIPYPQGSKLPISGKTWDGTAAVCTGTEGGTVNGNNCVVTYANGAPLPDGDYVYVLWAEIPYTDTYFNGGACYQNGGAKAGCTGTIATTGNNGAYTTTVTLGSALTCATDGIANESLTAKQRMVCDGAFTGVKTQRYYTDLLQVERGVVDITIQPVSYSTIGSSPTAYGLDPFMFKFSTARESVVNAYVKNTAGVTVKTLTTEGGNTSVSQQMNTLTWDGLDDNGRMVGPGTYLFVVEAADPMFPLSVKTQAAAEFPVDLYRITDVSTTDVYGDSEAKATISYMLSKAMNVQIDVYNKDVVIPAQSNTGNTTTTAETSMANFMAAATAAQTDLLPGVNAADAVPVTVTNTYVAGDQANSSYYIYTDPVNNADGTYSYYRARKSITAADSTANTETYTVDEVVKITVNPTVWPPRVCDRQTDSAYFVSATGPINVASNPKCIYVNDNTFTNYPANPNAAKYNYAEGARQTLDVRLQPVKTFNRSALRTGNGTKLTEEWDAHYFYNPTPVSIAAGGKNGPEAIAACTGATDITRCPYEMVPDGTYPFYVSATTDEPMDIYYDQKTGRPLRSSETIVNRTGWYATEKPVYRLNITRGPVYFLDGSVAVYPNAPQLFNTSSGPIFVPPYEINFAISRAATVEVAIVALKDNMCTTTRDAGTPYSQLPYNNKAGDVCKYLSTMTIPNTGNFDPNIVRRIYWDGTDNNGKYVKNGNYEIRLTAKNYPDEGLYQPTVKQLKDQNIDLLKVYDLPDAEAYAINVRGTDMNISYQLSVPMKVAIQIFKPGTTIYDYTKGTLRDPSTGQEVKDIRDVLVKSIVGIRPSTTLIEELWDGTDYAKQEVPDGTYPFRFVTALNSADIDSITGEILGADDSSTVESDWSINKVADTWQYANLHHATVAIGDGQFVCEDWEKTVFFYPNPFKTATGTMEITKLPVPGKMSIKLYNLAGDLVREGGYTCVDAQNMVVTMGGSLDVKPDNNVSNVTYDGSLTNGRISIRNAALRCFWDRTNDHGKKVARGVYFGLVDFRAQNGRQHCQKVVKILIPR